MIEDQPAEVLTKVYSNGQEEKQKHGLHLQQSVS